MNTGALSAQLTETTSFSANAQLWQKGCFMHRPLPREQNGLVQMKA